MKALYCSAAVLVTIAVAGCTVHQASDPPPLSGPSGLAQMVTVSAIPDSISQDGGSQSSIRITAFGPNGKALASLPLRIDTFVNGVGQDYGTLSARTVVTNSDGIATVVYTAPPSPAGGIFGTCRTLPGTCVDIVATPTGTGFDGAVPTSVQIRLVPPGVIQAPAAAPTAAFVYSPTAVTVDLPINFDASSSQPGVGASSITNYTWTFGDGTTGSGRTLTHAFPAANTFNVTLTVTNDRGLTSAPVSRDVTVAPSSGPTASAILPAAPRANDTVFFANTTAPVSGRRNVAFDWDFGDGTTGHGSNVSHVYLLPGAYRVVFTVTDDLGQKSITVLSVTIL